MKIIKSLLCLFLMISMISVNLHDIKANEYDVINESLNHLTFEILGDEAVLIECDYDYEGPVVIPKTYEGYPVTQIGENAFYSCYLVTEIIIPNTVTYIDDSAFCGINLETLILPESVTELGVYAFSECYIKDLYIYNPNLSFSDQYLYDTIIHAPKGSKAEQFAIEWGLIFEELLDIHDLESKIDLSYDSIEYSGSENKPAVTIDGLVEGIDFEVSYENNVEAGIATVTIKGIGEYCGVITKTFTIIRNIMDSDIKLQYESIVYSGLENKPIVTINGLTEGIDFEVSYENNIEVGVATVTIKGIGAYNGLFTKTFVIEPNPISEIVLNTYTETIIKGETLQLTATIIPDDTSDVKTLTWTSSDDRIATVDSNGFVQTYNPGEVFIKVETKNGTMSICKINVISPMTKLTLNYERIEMNVYDSIQLVSTIAPTDTTDTITWYSNDPNVAIVDSNGNVTAVGKGTASIVCISSNGLRDYCYIVIENGSTVISKESLTYTILSDNTVTITDCDYNVKGDLIIPETIDGYPVTRISQWAFSSCFYITSLEVPSTIIDIGNSAFYNCYGLKTIIFHSENLNIGSDAFYGTNKLYFACLKDSQVEECLNNYVYYYIDGTFEENTVTGRYNNNDWSLNKKIGKLYIDCSSSINYDGTWNKFYKLIKEIEITGNCQTIGDDLFRGYVNLEKVSLPKTLETINNFVFAQCESLKSIVIPENVNNIGRGTFYDCSSLIDVTILGPITILNDSLFENCNSLVNVQLPCTLNTFDHQVFKNCKNLTNIEIPSTLTSIDYEAFYGCDKLNKIELPMNVNYMGENVFNNSNLVVGCYKGSYIERYLVDNGILYYFIDGTDEENTISHTINDGFSWTLNLKTGHFIVYCDGEMSNYFDEIPWGNYKNFIVTAEIHGNCLNISEYAFAECSNLEKVSIVNTVTEIQYRAFYKCGALTSITLPEFTKYIGQYAFAGTAIKEIIIPKNVTSINYQALADISSLEKIIVKNPKCYISDILSSNNTYTVIYGYKNSTADNYSVAHGNDFIELEPTNISGYASNVQMEYDSIVYSGNENKPTITIEGLIENEDYEVIYENNTNPGKANVIIRGLNVYNGTITKTFVIQDNPITEITLNKQSLTLNKDETTQLIATINPINTSSDKTITWVSSNIDVVSVDENGNIQANNKGSATIIATTSNGLIAICEVTVIIPIESVQLNKTGLTLKINQTEQLIATINPNNTTEETTITWKSSIPATVTVDANGNLKALKSGRATIMLQLQMGKWQHVIFMLKTHTLVMKDG